MAPHASSRSTSAREWMPLSAMSSLLGTAALGKALGQALSGAKIDSEIGEVAVVDTNQSCVDSQRAFEFGLVVHLHQRGHPGT